MILLILLLFILFLNFNRHKKLYIVGNGKKYLFNVDVARTNDDIMNGLMGVKYIPPHYGMYFQFAVPQQASFWMKNTPSSLDILFIDASGQIISIEQGVPFSEKKIQSPGLVVGALEIRGGEAANLGIVPGFHITF